MDRGSRVQLFAAKPVRIGQSSSTFADPARPGGRQEDPELEAARLKAVHEARVKMVPKSEVAGRSQRPNATSMIHSWGYRVLNA